MEALKNFKETLSFGYQQSKTQLRYSLFFSDNSASPTMLSTFSKTYFGSRVSVGTPMFLC